MEHLRITTAREGDVGALVGLISSLFQEDAGVRDPHTNLSWPADHARGHFLGLLDKDDALCLVARSGGEIVGYLAGYGRGPYALRPVRVAELQSMYVRKAERGQGVGTRLVEGFLVWARDRDAEQVSVTAYAANERAIHFYERMGFEPRNVSLELGL
ncbi:GNAT family N-acetyltransferase [Rubrobacter tropicus]|uniref:GNAT family N-acetyltransferase n=1 Tax=Rubrobacter tropicus TaxID=2653851 RepID=A0A6G8Q8V0_9ACTN|nr:GNAT family N-acetyltransferase [Rubrobacter tropicus]QIN82900.1 GNAT family N-acetyltransferase [Rubrobacter tropicus]